MIVEFKCWILFITQNDVHIHLSWAQVIFSSTCCCIYDVIIFFPPGEGVCVAGNTPHCTNGIGAETSMSAHYGTWLVQRDLVCHYHSVLKEFD